MDDKKTEEMYQKLGDDGRKFEKDAFDVSYAFSKVLSARARDFDPEEQAELMFYVMEVFMERALFGVAAVVKNDPKALARVFGQFMVQMKTLADEAEIEFSFGEMPVSELPAELKAKLSEDCPCEKCTAKRMAMMN